MEKDKILIVGPPKNRKWADTSDGRFAEINHNQGRAEALKEVLPVLEELYEYTKDLKGFNTFEIGIDSSIKDDIETTVKKIKAELTPGKKPLKGKS